MRRGCHHTGYDAYGYQSGCRSDSFILLNLMGMGRKRHDLRFCRAVVRGLFAILYRFESVGVHNIPSEGGVLICSNHISVRDPISVGIHVKRQVKFMAKSRAVQHSGVRMAGSSAGAFPVKRGGVSKDSIKTALTILRSGEIMGIFPEGTRNSDATAAKRARQASLSAAGQRSYRLPSLETTSRSERSKSFTAHPWICPGSKVTNHRRLWMGQPN